MAMNQMKLVIPALAAAPEVSAMPIGPRRLHDEIAPVIMCHSPDSEVVAMSQLCVAPSPMLSTTPGTRVSGSKYSAPGQPDQPAGFKPALGQRQIHPARLQVQLDRLPVPQQAQPQRRSVRSAHQFAQLRKGRHRHAIDRRHHVTRAGHRPPMPPNPAARFPPRAAADANPSPQPIPRPAQPDSAPWRLAAKRPPPS